MVYLIALSLMFSGEAFARRILVEKDGEQRIEEIAPTGAVKGKILWDENVDGPMPANAVGGAMIVGTRGGKKALTLDLNKKAAIEAEQKKKESEKAKDRQEAIDRANRLALLKALAKERKLTEDEKEEAIRALLLK